MLKCGVKCETQPETKQPDIFKANCATCHLLDKDGTGPKLRGVLERVPDELWFAAFIRNEDSLTSIQDSFTLAVQTWSVLKWSHQFEHITADEMRQLKDFLSQGSTTNLNQ